MQGAQIPMMAKGAQPRMPCGPGKRLGNACRCAPFSCPSCREKHSHVQTENDNGTQSCLIVKSETDAECEVQITLQACCEKGAYYHSSQ